jgi:hypothetical protein
VTVTNKLKLPRLKRRIGRMLLPVVALMLFIAPIAEGRERERSAGIRSSGSPSSEVRSKSPAPKGKTSRGPSVKPKGSGGRVQVRGYTRKDGTYVAPHTRRAPRKRK